MIKDKLKAFHSTFISIAFGLFFFLLPISSFPLLSKLVGGTAVAPLSVVPAFLLFLALILPAFFSKQVFSYQFKPLLFFLIVAILSTSIMFFRELPSFREASPIKNALEGFITLFMGIAFYYLCAHFIRSEEKMKTMLLWMYLGFFFLVVISIFQAVYMRRVLADYPSWLARITLSFSSSGKIYPRRISGLAFEPSWLAHQLNLLYIPISLGFSLKGYSIFKFRLFKKVTVENLIFVTSIGLLFLTFSRIGWLTFLVLLIYLIFKAAKLLIGKLFSTIEIRRKTPLKPIQTILIKIGLWLAVLLLAIGLAILSAMLIAKLDPSRTARLIDVQAIKKMGLYGWANLIQIAERLIYWVSGFKVFQLHPWIGVGIGAMGFYFSGMVPAFGYMLPEVVSTINHQSFIPNAKNLWSRLLAETGIIGLAFFVSWVYLHWKSAKDLEKETNSVFYQSMALVGKLFIIAFIIEGFSMDTFGLPYYWVAFGLLVASWRMLKNQPPLSTDI